MIYVVVEWLESVVSYFKKLPGTEKVMSQNQYCGVFRADSALIIDADQALTLSNIPTDVGPVTLVVTTYYREVCQSQKVPHKLQLEVIGPADDVLKAKAAFLAVATTFSTMLSFLGNGYVDTPVPFVVYEVTEGKEDRDFLQTHIPDVLMQLEQARLLDIDLVSLALGKLGQSNEFKRLLRAIAQYHQVLVNWTIGTEITAAAHLWIAVETLTPIVLRRLKTEKGYPDGTNDDLANSLGIEKKDLDPHIRREIVFGGDQDTYRAIKDASEGFEHGYMEFGEIRDKAHSAADKAARCVREAIIRETAFDEDIRSALLAKNYGRPLMRGKLVKEMRGRLIGDFSFDDSFAGAHPHFDWKSTPQGVKTNDDGTFTYTFDESLNAHLPGSLKFEGTNFSVWGPPDEYKPRVQDDSGKKHSIGVGEIKVTKG